MVHGAPNGEHDPDTLDGETGHSEDLWEVSDVEHIGGRMDSLLSSVHDLPDYYADGWSQNSLTGRGDEDYGERARVEIVAYL